MAHKCRPRAVLYCCNSLLKPHCFASPAPCPRVIPQACGCCPRAWCHCSSTSRFTQCLPRPIPFLAQRLSLWRPTLQQTACTCGTANCTHSYHAGVTQTRFPMLFRYMHSQELDIGMVTVNVDNGWQYTTNIGFDLNEDNTVRERLHFEFEGAFRGSTAHTHAHKYSPHRRRSWPYHCPSSCPLSPLSTLLCPFQAH